MMRQMLCSGGKTKSQNIACYYARAHTLLLVLLLEGLFLKVIEIVFWYMNVSAVFFKEVFATEALCHSCERWWVLWQHILSEIN